MKVAVHGCCNGDLDKVYDAVRRLEKQGIFIDLLICCGDFHPIRDAKDLDAMNVPEEHKEMKDFRKYYLGEKQAPVTTLFIGGRSEPWNLLREHYFGGWVAPRVYYMGCAGVIRIGPLRIAGISGSFSPADYFRGHHECPPFTEDTKRTVGHVREWDASRLEKLQEPVDIVISYDWPRGIWKHGNYEDIFANDHSGDLKREMDGNTLGSPAAMDMLKKLRPPFWFAAKLNVKFPALMPHGDGTFTRFLALQRCRGSRELLQVLDVDPTSQSCMRMLAEPSWQAGRWARRSHPAPPICYDPEWLALQKVNHGNMTFSGQMERAKLVQPSKDEIAAIASQLKAVVGSVPRVSADSKRHPKLVPTKLREAAGEGKQSVRNLSTLQLRELYETRGLEFPGHLDKASMIKQLEEFDEFFAEEGGDAGGETEAYPIPLNFKVGPDNPAEQRVALLELLELPDVWKEQELQRQKLTKGQEVSEDYNPFSDAKPAAQEQLATTEDAKIDDGELDTAGEVAQVDEPVGQDSEVIGETPAGEVAQVDESVGPDSEVIGETCAGEAQVDEPVGPDSEAMGEAPEEADDLGASATALAEAMMRLGDEAEEEVSPQDQEATEAVGDNLLGEDLPDSAEEVQASIAALVQALAAAEEAEEEEMVQDEVTDEDEPPASKRLRSW